MHWNASKLNLIIIGTLIADLYNYAIRIELEPLRGPTKSADILARRVAPIQFVSTEDNMHCSTLFCL